ncbi:MAG: COX15/CtaA family protein [Candidatus Sericytochromatia bacterium]|nr:COX15/CtaA family protein [Candidatus Sericytochromatia bacterium]
MSDTLTFRRFGQLIMGLVGLTVLLVFAGVVVRATGSGLGCGTAGGWHDWPLCHGALLPPGEMTAVIEFTHRAIASVVSTGMLVAVGWLAWTPSLRSRLGGHMALACTLLVVQIGWGALIIRHMVPPELVVTHLATALAFFATMITLGLRAFRLADGDKDPSEEGREYLGLALGTTAAIYLQALAGGIVANFEAGLACPDFPTCHGEWLPAMVGNVALQMLHRYGAYLVTGLVVVLAWRTRHAAGWVRTLPRLAVGVLALQVALGILNVLYKLPLVVTAAHHGNAYLLFALLVALSWRLVTARQTLAATVTKVPAAA